MQTPQVPAPGAPQLRLLLDEALRYWEPRRIAYNLVLGAVVVAWVVLTWPHFRPALTLQAAALLLLLAVLANVCYCAAYLLDLPLQPSSLRTCWLRWRGALADEIYPYVPR